MRPGPGAGVDAGGAPWENRLAPGPEVTMRLREASALALLAAAACAHKPRPPPPEPPRPRLSLLRAAVESYDLEGAALALDCVLENPLPLPVSLAALSWTLEVEQARVASGDLPGGVQVAAQARAPVRISARFRFAAVPRFAMAAARGEMSYHLAASATVAGPEGPAAVPLDHQGTVRTPRLAEFGIAGLRIHSLSLSETSLVLRLRVNNPNDFALPAGEVGFELRLAGKEVASARARPLQGVPPRGEAVIPFPVRISILAAGRGLYDALRAGRVDAQVKGVATFSGIPVPLDLGASVPVERDGG